MQLIVRLSAQLCVHNVEQNKTAPAGEAAFGSPAAGQYHLASSLPLEQIIPTYIKHLTHKYFKKLESCLE